MQMRVFLIPHYVICTSIIKLCHYNAILTMACRDTDNILVTRVFSLMRGLCYYSGIDLCIYLTIYTPLFSPY